MYLRFLSILVYAVFLTSISYAKPPKVPSKDGEIGEFFWRPATRDIVRLLKDRMNESANPCENFNEFACGNYGKKSNYSPNREIQEKQSAYVKDLLLNKMSSISGSKVVTSTSKLMQSCLKYNRRGTVNKLYKQMVKKYAKTSLRDIFSEMAKFDIQTPFRTELETSKGKDYEILLLPPADRFSNSYYENLTNSAIDKMLKDKKMAKAVKYYNSRLNDLAMESTYSDVSLTYKLKWIDIQGIINDMDPTFLTTGKVKYDSYLIDLDRLIDGTAEEVVRAHTFVKATYNFIPFAKDFDEVIKEESTMEDVCTTMIPEKFPIVITTMLAQEFLPEELRDGVTELFDNVLNSIEETLKAQEWLGSSRDRAIEKIRMGANWLSLPTSLYNYTALDSYFESFPMFKDSMDAVHQFWDVLRYKQAEKVAILKKPAENFYLEYVTGSFGIGEINAGNLVGHDLIVFTMGMVQSPWYYYRFPAFFRYGLLGSIIGHEYAHGLAKEDTPGPYFTDGGPVSDETRAEYRERAQCFINQFNNETIVSVEGIKHKVYGEQYVNENLADNSGYHMAYKAYKKCSQSKKHEKRLEEIDGYSPEQLFFISAVQFDCAIVTEEYLDVHSRDVHAPGPLRVNSVKNNEHFAKAFKCPVGSKMNPVKKCRLWD